MSSLTRTPNPVPKTTAPKQLTYDEVSKNFSSPLADAAESLGVPASVLKKICQDNGLVRWPYRKFLLGKSIEQIKKDAARELTKRQKELGKTSGSVSNNSPMPAVVSFPNSFQLQNKATSSPEVLKSHAVMQPQAYTNVQVTAPQVLHTSSELRGTETDEFVYGFPSQGLSTVSHRWWDSTEESENKGLDVSMGSLETGPLSCLRKRAAEEGREGLKLGVHKRYAMSTLDSTKKKVLRQVFKSSLPTL